MATFKKLNPGNGTETPFLLIWPLTFRSTFKKLNPGNGTETRTIRWAGEQPLAFKKLNPGNGTETMLLKSIGKMVSPLSKN